MEFRKGNRNILYQIFLLLSLLQIARSSKILVVAPIYAFSHAHFIHPICKDLAMRGHEVTIITAIEVNDPPPKLEQILVDVKLDVIDVPYGGMFCEYDHSIFQIFDTLMSIEGTYAEKVLSDPKVKALIDDRSAHFDLVMVEHFYQQAMYMFAHIFQAPLVLFTSTDAPHNTHVLVGNPYHYSFMNYEFSRDGFKTSFYKRFMNIYHNILTILNNELALLPVADEVAKIHFGHLKKHLPSVKSLAYNTSLVIFNGHFSLGETIPLIPAMVDAAGIHIKPVKALPKDIKDFLDGAENGVIVFSLGSQLYSTHMKEEVREAFVKALSKRKEKILWKWEDDNPPDVKNALFIKWLPLNDVLAHKNIKLFIGHGGMLSTQEAVDKGVPILGMPVYGDQFLNIDKLVAKGAAVKLDYGTIDEKSVTKGLNTIINGDHTRRMKAVSARFRDRPLKPLDSVAYWIEYVIKHGGESLKPVQAIELSLLQYYCIDILVFLMACFTLPVWFLTVMIRKFKGRTTKTKKD